MEGRVEYAAGRKREMNCCQAVLVAFADVLGRSEAELLRMGSGFGSGMGTMGGRAARSWPRRSSLPMARR